MSLQQYPSGRNILNEKYIVKTGELGPIFIVDDNEDDQFFLGHEIKALFGEASVQIFKNGRQLLEYLYEVTKLGRIQNDRMKIPRLILMDLYMPGMDGLSTLRALRQDLRIESIPVVMLSNTKNIREIEKSYEYGATVFLPKPFSRKEFIQAVHHHAGLSHIN